jgi:DNA-binding transcriptional regulator LsrR (DeoR family)
VALAITGIGTMVEEASSFLRAGHLTVAELAQLREQGIVGETCGRFFDAWGRCEGFAINERVIGIALDDLRRIPRVIAVARGLPKARSILAALRVGYMTVLATDDVTARAILAANEPQS